MKNLFTRLGVLGPSHYRSLLEQLGKTQSRCAKLAEELELSRDDAKRLKERSDDAARALRDSKVEAERHRRLAEKLTAELEKIKAESERRHERDGRKLAEVEQKRGRAIDDLTGRLEKAERALTVARQTLIAIEVKLDILEGAANVLDIRTRTMSSGTRLGGDSASM